MPRIPKSSKKKTKFRKRRDGPCEVCGHRGCPACSETELFRSMGIRDYETITEANIWVMLEHQVDAVKAELVSFRVNPKVSAPCFSKAVNKLMLLFEEACRRRNI